jgi:hypothetical protein
MVERYCDVQAEGERGWMAGKSNRSMGEIRDDLREALSVCAPYEASSADRQRNRTL